MDKPLSRGEDRPVARQEPRDGFRILQQVAACPRVDPGVHRRAHRAAPHRVVSPRRGAAYLPAALHRGAQVEGAGTGTMEPVPAWVEAGGTGDADVESR